MHQPKSIYLKIGVGVILAGLSWYLYIYMHPVLLPVMVVLSYLLANLDTRPANYEDSEEEEFDGDAPLFTNDPDSGLSSVQDMEGRLQLVIDGTNDGIWDWDIARDKVFWSDRVYQILSMDKGALEDKFDKFKSHLHPKDRTEFDKALRNHLVYNSPFNIEIRIIQSTEVYQYLRIRGKVKRNKQNKAVRMAGSISDITDQKLIEKELRHNAYHDRLTLLPNRACFVDELSKVLYKTKENSDYIFAVIIIGIDKFKAINENMNHQTGDELLKEVAKRIHKCLRGPDILSRMSGDEFAIIVNDIRQAGDATHFSQRVKTELSKPFHIGTKDIFISVSMGIVFNNETHDATEVLLRDANTSLSQAKKKGKGTIEVFSQSMRDKEYETYKLELNLRQAIDRDELFLSYQPIYNIPEETIGAFEVLVRWKHPSLGIIRPVIFIPVAEESGLIMPIGEWILKKACIQMKKWVDQGFDKIIIAVNVSAPQFSYSDVPKSVERVLRETGLEAKYLKVEITESVAMKDVTKTIETLQKLHDIGLQISIDDFGTGYSSLSYLKQYPIDTLKIDRSFIKDIPSKDKDNESITATIIAMAKNLNLSIIAEGVETEEQLNFLKGHDCDQIQGFFFSKPLLVDDATALLEKELQNS